jgi:hypothetical protein
VRLFSSGSSFVQALCKFAVTMLVAVAMLRAAFAAEPGLKIGDQYKIVVERQSHSTTHEGALIQATPQWLALKMIVDRNKVSGMPYLRDLPRVGKWFGSKTPIKVDVILWIPRDAAKIESHEPAAALGLASPIKETEPPIHRPCTVLLMEGGKATSRSGELTMVDEKMLTLTPDGPAEKPWEKLPRDDVMCCVYSMAALPTIAQPK